MIKTLLMVDQPAGGRKIECEGCQRADIDNAKATQPLAQLGSA